MHGLGNRDSPIFDGYDELEWSTEYLSRICGNARTYVYEYQRQNAQMDVIETVDHAAEDLLFSWERTQASSSCTFEAQPTEDYAAERPLLFVCDGLGSAVVEKALLLGTEGEGRTMSRCAFGIIYLGASHARDTQAWTNILSKEIAADGMCSLSKCVHPHRSRDWEGNIADTHCSINGKAGTSSRRRYENLPQHISGIHTAFGAEVWEYTTMHFCLDTDSSSCPGTLIHQDCLWSVSSQARISRHESTHYIIPDALPRAIAKTVVALAIRSMGEAAAQDSRERHTWLADQQMLKEMHSQQRLGRTGNWLLKSDKLQAWSDPTGSGLFWLHGAPGTGKSNLCSTLIDKLQWYEEDEVKTFFCFFDNGLGGLDPAKYIMKTFLYQFDGCRQALIPNHLLRCAIRSLERLSNKMTMKEFQEHLGNVLHIIPIRAQVLLVLDGLDELDDENWIKQAVIDGIIDANRSMKRPKPLRCIISSRKRYSSPSREIMQVSLDGEPGVREDVRRFVSTWLTDLPQSVLFGKISSTSVEQQLCSQANGVFLYAALAIENIFCMHSLENLVGKIKAMPTSIEGQYQQMVAAISSSELEIARTVFSWLIGARRLLYLSDFHGILGQKAVKHPLTFGTPSASNKTFKKRIEHLSEADISRICGGLVVFAYCGIAQFRHEGIRDYLMCPNKSSIFKDSIVEAHELIAKTCLRHLSETLATEGHALLPLTLPSSHQISAEPPSSLTKYAVRYWSFHYRQAESHSRVLPGILQRYLSNHLYKACDALVIRQTQRMAEISSTILRFSAFHGFAALAKMSLEMGGHPNGSACDRCKTPLAIAAEERPRDRQLLGALLRKGAATTSNATTDFNATLLLAASQGLLDAVELNLARGADVQVANNVGKTSLHIAASLGNLQMVKLLMGFNADMNATIPDTAETPLHIAASHGYLDIVKCLVDNQDALPREINLYQEITQESSYQDWKTSLVSKEVRNQGVVWEMDARNSIEKRMQELSSCSDRYVDIERKTDEGSTPLHLAATNGNEETVRYLVSRGAATQTLTKVGRTPFQNAAENGQLNTMRLLMGGQTELNKGPDKLRSTIQTAHMQGHQNIVNALSFGSFGFEIMRKPCPWSTVAVAAKHSPCDMSQIT